MTLKEYINENPAPNGAAAILNICTAWVRRLYPEIVLSNRDCLTFVGALSEYLDMEYQDEQAQAAEYVAELFRRM